MTNWCCQTWLDLGPELAEMKWKALEKLIKRGIPRSTFSPIIRILEGLTNFCPLCGSKITSGSVIAPSSPKTEITSKPAESKSLPTVKCPVCKGTGKAAAGLNCMICLGTGVLDKSNPHRASFDPVFAEEMGTKLGKVHENIIKKTTEIEKNPQPLRDDAKPENWNKYS